MTGVSLVVEGAVDEGPWVVDGSTEVGTGPLVVPLGLTEDEPGSVVELLLDDVGEGSTPVGPGVEVTPGSVPVGGGGGVSVEPPEEHAKSAGRLRAAMVRATKEMERLRLIGNDVSMRKDSRLVIEGA